MSKFKYYISKISRPTPDLIVIEASDPKGKPVFSFRPGQYAMISYRSPEGRILDKHAFSLASSPTDSNAIRFGIRIQGNFTQGLQDLSLGDELFVDGPHGNFVYNNEMYPDLVMIAGGIGITPFISTLRYLDQSGIKNKATLLYSVRNSSQVAFSDEIKEIVARNKNINVKYSFSDEEGKDNANTVYRRFDVQDLAPFCGNDLRERNFFLCGPPVFMRAMKENLISLGVFPEQISSEEFSMIPDRNVWFRLRNTVGAMAFSLSIFIIAFSLINKHTSAATQAPVAAIDQALQQDGAITLPLEAASPSVSPTAQATPVAQTAPSPITTYIPSASTQQVQQIQPVQQTPPRMMRRRAPRTMMS